MKIHSGCDRSVIHALLFAVPLLWEMSVVRFGSNSKSGCKNMIRRMAQLCDEGLIKRHTACAQVAAEVELFYFWAPQMRAPDFGARGWALSRLWEKLEPRPIAFYCATDLAARHFGCWIRNPLKITALSHNIGLGQLYTYHKEHYPLLIRGWVSEEVIADARGYGEKVVDACIVDSTSTPALALEFAGASYGASNGQRLKEIHLDCARRNLPYEIWTIAEGETR